ncbi:uncharacterized protein LOC104893473 [Beta vulgaris subsp. vulgaris]|uniref:uncharacterized protein LOC104893473 n=1 Tax=Beta vulgaris subsp. vulgaris TaxID=3555 RepID=UPI002549A175|nr:uncharacterized protein LOC104893473 [Beta vulgaris subsp. vulgaris]
MRRFSVSWFDKYDWLEYSVEKDATFCFVCYLFKDKTSYPGGDSFVNGGFRSWNKPDRFKKHIGGINSAHNQAQEKYQLFTNPKASINESLNHQSAEATALYKARLTYSLKCLRFLSQQGLAFRGHDESEVSSNKGNFLELLSLSLSKVRGQGYDGAISCKRREMLRVIQAQEVVEALNLGEIESGQGLNHERGLGRPGETRGGSYYKTILNIITLYSTIIKVLVIIGNNTSYKEDRGKAQAIMNTFESFEFIFMAHLMLEIFGYTDVLSNALQRKEQNIVNAMALISLTKSRLQKMRDEKWEDFLDRVCSFCAKHAIGVPNMDDTYVPRGRSKRFFAKVTNLHRFRVEMFLCVIDLQLQELNNRFNEVNMELLTCMACFSPLNSFASFDEKKLVRLAEFYEKDFSTNDLVTLHFELELFIDDMRKDENFRELKDLGELSMMLVETEKHTTYKLVYLLLRLVLILHVATASVERVFSSMKTMKSKLRNSMGDQFLNDCLVTYIERDLFLQVSDDDVIKRFQSMKDRRMHL